MRDVKFSINGNVATESAWNNNFYDFGILLKRLNVIYSFYSPKTIWFVEGKFLTGEAGLRSWLADFRLKKLCGKMALKWQNTNADYEWENTPN